MRVLVCGSRTWSDLDPIRERLRQFPPSTIIIHGAAPGADLIADGLAEYFGFGVEAYPANWQKYGKRAGPMRNIEMLDSEPNLVLAYWDGESPGTAHTIREAQKRGIKVEIIKGEDKGVT